MTCSIKQYIENCERFALELDWPEEPVDNSFKDLDTIAEINWPQQGNVLIDGLNHGYEINHLLKLLGHDQVLFVVDRELSHWHNAASCDEAQQWPLGQQLFFFKTLSALTHFFTYVHDLMPPTEIISLGTPIQGSTQCLKNIHDMWSRNISDLQNKYKDFLLSQPSQKKTVILKPDSHHDQLLMELVCKQYQDSQMPIDVYETKNTGPRQLTPYWLIKQLILDEVTNIIATNKSRQDLYPLVPIECHFTILAYNPIPDLFEPGAQPVIGLQDQIVPLNNHFHALAQEKFPNNTTSPLYLISDQHKIKKWHERTYDLCAFGDAPDNVFENKLLAHPQLGPLFKRFTEILRGSPAFISLKDQELLFSLCEHETDCFLHNVTQRVWLMDLVRVLIVGAYNRRKALVDLVRHRPDIKLSIIGKGWEDDDELKPYVTQGKATHIESIASSKIVLFAEGLIEKMPSHDFLTALTYGCVPVICMHHEESKEFTEAKLVTVENLQQLEATVNTLLNNDQALCELTQHNLGYIENLFNTTH